MMLRLLLFIGISIGVSLPPTHAQAQPSKASEKKLDAKQAASAAAKEIPWEALIPPGWNPMKDLDTAELGGMNDGDPRATKLLKRIREVWDQAPANTALEGALIRIPGYVVPLEESKDGMKEFLLVPYFGACIHSPPPPANQIIHVISNKPLRGLRSMESVWVQGRLQVFRGDSVMGVSGYRVESPAVELYVEKNQGGRSNQ